LPKTAGESDDVVGVDQCTRGSIEIEQRVNTASEIYLPPGALLTVKTPVEPENLAESASRCIDVLVLKGVSAVTQIESPFFRGRQEAFEKIAGRQKGGFDGRAYVVV
jgi:hypothetical protein